MRPIVFTRESLHPVWSDLCERVGRTRTQFEAGSIDEKTFRARLNYLGFTSREIEIEVAQSKSRIKT